MTKAKEGSYSRKRGLICVELFVDFLRTWVPYVQWGEIVSYFHANSVFTRFFNFNFISIFKVECFRKISWKRCCIKLCIHVQVNLCQKLLFLNQLTHNMSTDCLLLMKTVSSEYLQNMLCTQIVVFVLF